MGSTTGPPSGFSSRRRAGRSRLDGDFGATSTIISPALLHVLLPWVSDGEAPQIDLVGMLGALLATELLPLLLGLVVRHRRPKVAIGCSPPPELVSKLLNLSGAANYLLLPRRSCLLSR